MEPMEHFFKKGHSRPLFLFFVFSVNKLCKCWDSNHGPLVSEATALPTEAQPLPYEQFLFSSFQL